MRRFWRLWLSILACAIGATFVLALPQALAVGAPDRGVVASGVTLVAFFLALLVVAAWVASVLALGLEALLDRLGIALPAPVRAAMAAGWMGLILLVMPGIIEVLGLLGAWIAAAAAGRLAVRNDATGHARLYWRSLLLGTLAATATGLALLWI